MGLGTRGILNFGPCAEWGHPELSPVGTDDDAPRAGCLFTNPGDLSHTSKLIELTRFSAPLIRSRPWRFINPFTYLLTYLLINRLQAISSTCLLARLEHVRVKRQQ